MKLNEKMIFAAPLLEAVAACEADAVEATNVRLAEMAGRSAKNMPRDLAPLLEAGWIARETGSPVRLTDDGREVLAMLARANAEPDAGGGAQEIALHLIDPDPELNPRDQDEAAQDAEADADLTASIGFKGVLQPIKVRPNHAKPGRFLVVMGWRRWKCAQAAGLFTIPATVEDMTDDEAFEAAVVENEQRANMNPLDKAKAYRRIVDRYLASHDGATLKQAKEHCARVVGNKTARTIELHLQLEALPAIKQVELRDGKIGLKEAIQWQRSQPKPVDLEPGDWLMLIEVFAKCRLEPKPDEYHDRRTPCRLEAGDDERVKVLGTGPHYFVDFDEFEWVRDETGDSTRAPRASIAFKNWTMTQMRMRFGQEFDADDASVAAALEAARMAAGATVEGEGWAVEWLNGPYEFPAEAIAKLEAQNREDAERNAGWERQRKERDAAQKAAEARQARDYGDEGRAFLAAVRQLEAEFPDRVTPTKSPRFQRRFGEVQQLGGCAGPYALADDRKTAGGEIRDGTGERNAATGFALEARRRLIVIALNFASGLEPVSGEPFPEPGEAPAQVVADLEDGDDDEDDDAEDEAEQVGGGGGSADDGAGEDDPEFSPALLALVGGDKSARRAL